jgi:hypothetical protein
MNRIPWQVILNVVLIAGWSIFNITRLIGEEPAPVEKSPHSEALQLVFTKEKERIRTIDQEVWWIDDKERAWSVKRPFEPGFIDSTHWFVVRYSVDGKVVSSWSVDIETKDVVLLKVREQRTVSSDEKLLDESKGEVGDLGPTSTTSATTANVKPLP